MCNPGPPDPTPLPGTHRGILLKIKLPRRFYTIEQLAERWECPVEDITHQIETETLEAVHKGAALFGRKYIRVVVCQTEEECRNAILQKRLPKIRFIPVEKPFDKNEVSDDEIIQMELKKLRARGELDRVIMADEVMRFEREYSEAEDAQETAVVEANPPRAAYLTSKDMAIAFAGLNGWNRNQWESNLGDPAGWMKPAMIHCGGPPNPNRWNPVELATTMMAKKNADDKELNKRFTTEPLLQPWLAVWQPYADLIRND